MYRAASQQQQQQRHLSASKQINLSQFIKNNCVVKENQQIAWNLDFDPVPHPEHARGDSEKDQHTRQPLARKTCSERRSTLMMPVLSQVST